MRRLPRASSRRSPHFTIDFPAVDPPSTPLRAILGFLPFQAPDLGDEAGKHTHLF
jgi:hypothetical protein